MQVNPSVRLSVRKYQSASQTWSSPDTSLHLSWHYHYDPHCVKTYSTGLSLERVLQARMVEKNISHERFEMHQLCHLTIGLWKHCTIRDHKSLKFDTFCGVKSCGKFLLFYVTVRKLIKKLYFCFILRTKYLFILFRREYI